MPDRQSEFHPSAQSELTHAIQYYETRVPGLGAEFLIEVRRAVSLISEFPELGPLIWGARRRILVKRFPYGLVYRILGNGNDSSPCGDALEKTTELLARTTLTSVTAV